MRCPSCGFVSFDHLMACKRCGKDLPQPPGGRRLPAPASLTGEPLPDVAAPSPGPDPFSSQGGTETIVAAARPAAAGGGSAAPGDTVTFTLPPAPTPAAAPAALFDPGAAVLAEEEWRPAGFWIRFVATVLDEVILIVVILAVTVPVVLSAGITSAMADPRALGQALAGMGGAAAAVFIGIPLLYEVIFIGRRGQTPGKMALRLKVIRADGGEVDYVKAFIRWFGKVVSGFILGIGYLMAAFTRNKRALHDMIAATRVVRL